MADVDSDFNVGSWKMKDDGLDEAMKAISAIDETMKAAVEESIDLLSSFIRDKSLPLSDCIEVAAILLRSAPFAELGCLEFDLVYLKRQSADSN